MPEMTRSGQKIVNAELGQKTEYVRIVDWEGKSLTFILVNEIRPEERSAYLGPGEDRREADVIVSRTYFSIPFVPFLKSLCSFS